MCEIAFYLQLTTDGSESLHQESSKVFVFSFFGLFGNTHLHVQLAALYPLITDILTNKRTKCAKMFSFT